MKRLVLTILAVLFLPLVVLLAPSASAGDRGEGHTPVVVCHATPAADNQPTEKYERLVVDDDSTKLEGHKGHSKDLIGEPGDLYFECPVIEDEPSPTPTPTETTPTPTPTETTPTPTPTETSPTPTPTETSPTPTPTPTVCSHSNPCNTKPPCVECSPAPTPTETDSTPPPATSTPDNGEPPDDLARTGASTPFYATLALVLGLIGAVLIGSTFYRRPAARHL